MRLCFALLYRDPQHAADGPAEALARVRLAHDLPRALADRGHDIHVVHLHGFDTTYERDGVRHHFVAPGVPAAALAVVLTRGPLRDRARLTSAWRAITRVRRVRPDVIHFFGTSLHLNLALLSARLAGRDPPVVVHHHGGRPATSLLGRPLQRFGLGRSSRVLFTTREQAQMYVEAGLVDDASEQCVHMVEGSSTFSWRPRSDARRSTGMNGAPVCLSAARLDPLKDPHTVLRGFERIAASEKGARLYLHYQSGELLPDLRSWVAARPKLHGRVLFQGPRPYEAMEDVYNSADFLLQASLREHSGFAVLDAMACGVIPVITDIPSFRTMTDAGRVGALFPVGDDAALARRVRDICGSGISRASDATRTRFDHCLSYPALARQLEGEYRRLIE